MSVRALIIKGAVAAVAVGLLARTAANSLYFNERTDLLTQIQQRERVLEQFSRERRDLRAMRARLQEIADGSLGGSAEVVDAALRERLNRIVEEIGLASTSVTTGQPVTRGSPAARRMGRNPARGTADFLEMDGTVTGDGSLEQALRLVHRIEAEPWHKRVNSVSLNPSADGSRVKVSVRLTTMFLPGRQPSPNAGSAVLASYDAASFDRYARFAAMQPFQVPPPPVRVTEAPPPPPPPTPPAEVKPPPFPYGKWALTAVTESSRGPEAWLLNRESGESVTLALGGKLNEAELLAVRGDQAEFRIGESRFLIAVGTTLRDRQPVGR